MKKLLVITLLTANLFGFNSKQKEIAKLVYEEWSKVKIDGKIFPTTGVLICYLESSIGLHLIGDMNSKVTEASLGIMQVRLETARFVGKVYRKFSFINNMSDTSLVNFLIKNHRMNARIDAYYFKYNYERFKSHSKAVSCQNGGLYNKPYLKRFKEARKELWPLIKEIKNK